MPQEELSASDIVSGGQIRATRRPVHYERRAAEESHQEDILFYSGSGAKLKSLTCRQRRPFQLFDVGRWAKYCDDKRNIQHLFTTTVLADAADSRTSS